MFLATLGSSLFGEEHWPPLQPPPSINNCHRTVLLESYGGLACQGTEELIWWNIWQWLHYKVHSIFVSYVHLLTMLFTEASCGEHATGA